MTADTALLEQAAPLLDEPASAALSVNDRLRDVLDVLSGGGGVDRDDLPGVVDQVRPTWHRSGSLLYARRTFRLPLPVELCLHGLDDGLRPVTAPLVVTGRDVSADGISFQHEHPLPFRLAALTFRTPRGPITLVARLLWCRCDRTGRFVSGGRLLRPVRRLDFTDPEHAVPDEWSNLVRG